MAVDAAHVTFLDLTEHAWPAAVDHELGDRCQLGARIAMVEFEDQHVRCAAVHTRMGA